MFFYRINNVIKDYGRVKKTHIFEENDESRLYRKFLNTWSEYYTKKKEDNLNKKNLKLLELQVLNLT